MQIKLNWIKFSLDYLAYQGMHYWPGNLIINICFRSCSSETIFVHSFKDQVCLLTGMLTGMLIYNKSWSLNHGLCWSRTHCDIHLLYFNHGDATLTSSCCNKSKRALVLAHCNEGVILPDILSCSWCVKGK